MALEHSQLTAQHEDLCALGHRVHRVDVDRFEKAADKSVEEREGHGGERAKASYLVKPRDE